MGIPRWCGSNRNCRRRGFSPWVGKIPGAGNGSPLQYSCLENPMDRGAWRATVPGMAKSRNGLSNGACPLHDVTSLIFWRHLFPHPSYTGLLLTPVCWLISAIPHCESDISIHVSSLPRSPLPSPTTPYPSRLSQSTRLSFLCYTAVSHWLSIFNSVQLSRSVVSDSLRLHGLQHARPPCPSPTPRVY